MAAGSGGDELWWRDPTGLSAATSERRGTLRGCPEVSPFRVTPILRQIFSGCGPSGTAVRGRSGGGREAGEGGKEGGERSGSFEAGSAPWILRRPVEAEKERGEVILPEKAVTGFSLLLHGS